MLYCLILADPKQILLTVGIRKLTCVLLSIYGQRDCGLDGRYSSEFEEVTTLDTPGSVDSILALFVRYRNMADGKRKKNIRAGHITINSLK